jgi:hypothetical protein
MRVSQVSIQYNISTSTIIKRLKRADVILEKNKNCYIVTKEHLKIILSYGRNEKPISNKMKCILLDFRMVYPMFNNSEIADVLAISEETVTKVLGEEFIILPSKLNSNKK